MQAQSLDRHIILAGWYGGNRDTMVLVGSIDLADDTGACAIISIENDQHRILVLVAGSGCVELELYASFVDVLAGRERQTVCCLCGAAEEQAG